MTHVSKILIQAMDHIPELFTGPSMSILYVGAHHKEITMVPELLSAGHVVDLLELVPNFARRFMPGGMSEGIFNEVFIGNVCNIQYIPGRAYDTTVWWHGPEHIKRVQLESIIDEIEFKTKRLVVLACPYGDSRLYRDKPQLDERKRPGQYHLSKLYPEDFGVLGYTTRTVGQPDASALPKHASQLMAWKWMS